MSEWSLRVRAVLDEWDTAVVAALVVAALACGWVAYGAYASPDTKVEEQTVSSWRTTGEFDHGANVTEENSVFDAGTRLENRTTYFRSVAPVLDGTFRATHAGGEAADLSMHVDVTLVLRSVDADREADEETEYWRETRELGSERLDDASASETVAVPFSVDVNEVENRTSEIRSELGGDPGQVEASVRATVEYAGTVDGREIDRTAEYSLLIGVDGGTYRVEDSGRTNDRHAVTRTETVTEEPGLVSGIAAPVLFAVSLIGAGFVVAARRRALLELTPEERAWLDFRADRSDFEEWIVTMRLPDETADLPRAEAETLADLVDFAIDTDNAVVEHPETGVFSVVHDGWRYVFEPPQSPKPTEDAERDESTGVASVDTADEPAEGVEQAPPPTE